jgi:DNA-nicking Smr family endonuclease
MSDDDEAVWAHTASSVAPLKGPKSRVHPALEDGVSDVVFTPRGKGTAHAPRPATTPAPPRPVADAPAKRAVPSIQPFDPKRARRLRAGRIEIEARIDLHGMKQAEAHAALRRFLVAAHRDGKRTVLVITGKGGPAKGSSDDERPWGHGHARGVLKRNVPHWLGEAELRRIVVSFTAASARHGGEGAIYVHLRSALKLDGTP